MKVYILSWAVVCSDWKPLITLHRKQEISSLDLGKMWQKKKRFSFSADFSGLLSSSFSHPIVRKFQETDSPMEGWPSAHLATVLVTLGQSAGSSSASSPLGLEKNGAHGLHHFAFESQF